MSFVCHEFNYLLSAFVCLHLEKQKRILAGEYSGVFHRFMSRISILLPYVKKGTGCDIGHTRLMIMATIKYTFIASFTIANVFQRLF